MDKTLTLEVVTPQKVLMETQADYVTIPGEIGELGVLPGHIPLLSKLQSGVLGYRSSGGDKKIAVHYGYAEICNDKITILADYAELGEEIDIERSKNAQRTAEEELPQVISDVDKLDEVESLQKKLKRSITRQSAAQ